jgi:CHAT domain-containing protein
VCFVPSEELFYVPLHAIPVDGSPFVVRNPVFYAPSASTLRYCVHRRNNQDHGARRAAVFGHPTYDLRHTIDEARKIAALLGTQPLFGVDITRQRWLDAMTDSDIIHYAGHAEFGREDPLASCLFLNDGRLTARDLFALNRGSLRLITLSACETGVNRIHAGDELLGLTHALLYAGASSLLLTLWLLHDQSSPELMTEFYDRWLNRGERKVDALRHAQIAMLERGHTNPFYWAPYVLIGDWE